MCQTEREYLCKVIINVDKTVTSLREFAKFNGLDVDEKAFGFLWTEPPSLFVKAGSH